MRGLLATVLILSGMLLLSACTKEEEVDEEPTTTVTRTATAVATKTATATPAGAAASPTPGRDFVRRPNVPTRTSTATVAPVQTAAAQPTAVPPTAVPPTAVPPTAAPPPPVVPTAAPTPVPTQTQAPQPPWWEASAPLDPVATGTTVELSIHNANGAPGEAYEVAMLVRLPDQTNSVQQGTVSGDAWLTFYFSDTWQTGFYDVYFGLPQSDLIYAQTWFEVVGESPPPSDVTSLSWQVSAPRQAVAAGTTVELGLRNEYGMPGECYDFVVEVYDPDGYYASGQDTVCADEWTYLTYSDTWTSGYYDVSYYIGDQFIASDYFQVGY
jgi:hypothetical protein